MTKSGISVILAVVCLSASAARSMAQTYTVTDLGAPNGNTISQATALNNAGEAVGDSYDPGDLTGVIFSGGKVTSIVGTPNAINGLGQIA